MPLTKLEREALMDSMLKIQSIQASLEHVDNTKVLDMEGIQECLENADHNFRHALRNGPPTKTSSSPSKA
jgi:hypothetical protein